MYARLQRAFSNPRAVTYTFLAALLLGGVSITSGLAADDHIHQLIVSGSREIRGVASNRFDLFRFATPVTTPILMTDGVFPWWADPNVNFGFWRPLTSLMHYVDHALWPDSPALMHVHTMLWHALGLLGLWCLYRSLITPQWVATLALFLYALDDARGGPLTWIANRHAVIGTTLSIWSLWAYHRARAISFSAREGSPVRCDLLALGLFVLALLASQGSVSTCGYLFAHALFIDSDSWKRRSLRLLPYATAVVVWGLASRALDYGVHGSDVYFDPLSQPLLYARALLERGPILWLGQLAAPWSEIWNLLPLFAPWLMPVLFILALLVIAAWARVLMPLWRSDPTVRVFVVGALISTLPASAAFPADRLLTWVAIGASAFIAQFLGRFIESRAAAPAANGSVLASLVALSVVVFHVVLAPLLLPGRAVGTASTRRSLDLADNSVPQTPEIADKTVVMVNPPSDAYVGYIPFRRAADHVPRPACIRWLATGLTDVTVERIDARTLRVHQSGGYLQAMSEQLLRSPRTPFTIGQRIDLKDFSVEVTKLMPDGRPLEVLVRFGRPLEDPRYLWLMWKDKGYVPFRPPAIGERVTVPHFDPMKVAFG